MNQRLAMLKAKEVILEVCERFEKLSGRKYGLFEEYRMEGARAAIVIIGSAAGNTKNAVDILRDKGIDVGMIKVRVFRPFPGEELAEALKGVSAVAILDRAESFSGCGGPLGSELKAAMLDAGLSIPAINYFYGLAGRDFTDESAVSVFEDLLGLIDNGTPVEQFRYIGLRK